MMVVMISQSCIYKSGQIVHIKYVLFNVLPIYLQVGEKGGLESN